MATLSPELVTQRASKTMVSVDASSADDATSEVVWAATTSGTTVTITKAIDNNQKVRSVFEARLADDPTWAPSEG